jgi:hypothetical protein
MQTMTNFSVYNIKGLPMVYDNKPLIVNSYLPVTEIIFLSVRMSYLYIFSGLFWISVKLYGQYRCILMLGIKTIPFIIIGDVISFYVLHYSASDRWYMVINLYNGYYIYIETMYMVHIMIGALFYKFLYNEIFML